MLNVGVIGYGGRASGMAKALGMYAIPCCVAAIADPRAELLRQGNDPFLKDTAFYPDVDALLAAQSRGDLHLDGLMIGTRCYLHTAMACKVAPLGLPLFLEKPVAITFEQVKALDSAYRGYPAPTVVSFPLRLTPMVQTVKQLLEADTIGTVEHVIAFNDVPYGDVYYNNWYRNYDQVGGLFLQKATHDLDYVHYLLAQRPHVLCAMQAQRIYGPAHTPPDALDGRPREAKPFDLRCVDCAEAETCPESHFSMFRDRFQGEGVEQQEWRMCAFAEGIRNEDLGNCLIEYENGAQASYTQNFYARFKAARRGARLYGYRGTIQFDWYQNLIQVYKHQSPLVETIDFTGEMSHFGGDRELCLDFLRAMRDGTPSRSPIAEGILSALTCLWARESAETKRFCEVVMP